MSIHYLSPSRIIVDASILLDFYRHDIEPTLDADVDIDVETMLMSELVATVKGDVPTAHLSCINEILARCNAPPEVSHHFNRRVVSALEDIYTQIYKTWPDLHSFKLTPLTGWRLEVERQTTLGELVKRATT